MSLELPQAICSYVTAINQRSVEKAVACFSESAAVNDEGHTFKGRTEIALWIAATIKKYEFTLEPIGISGRPEAFRVEMQVSGSFEGSPVTLAFSFGLQAGKIHTLSIN